MCRYFMALQGNLKNFKPLQITYKNTSGRVIPIDCNLENVKGLVFARMAVSKKEAIPYEITDPAKTNDLPILVAVRNIKLNMPVQIAGYHIGRPGQEYTGSLSYKELTDLQAEALIKDAIKSNPSIKEPLEQLLRKYITLIENFSTTEDNKYVGYIPSRDDVFIALKQYSKNKSFYIDVNLDALLNLIEDNINKLGLKLAEDWRTVTEKNIAIWAKNHDE